MSNHSDMTWNNEEVKLLIHEAREGISTTGQYWEGYVSQVLNTIENDIKTNNGVGFDKFRQDPRLEGFIDNQQFPTYLKGYGLIKKILNFTRSILIKIPKISGLSRVLEVLNVYEDMVTQLYEDKVALGYNYLRSIDPTIESISDSCVGSPRFWNSSTGKSYTLDFLQKFLKTTVMDKSIDFKSVNTVVELGGGFGVQAEVMLKKYPHLNYIIVDLPSQLLVSQNYLKKVFKEKVITFGQIKENEFIDDSIFSKEGGNILMVPAAHVAKLKLKCDLFVAEYALMEMEHKIIENYLKSIGPLMSSASYVFIADRLKMHSGSIHKSNEEDMSIEILKEQFGKYGFEEKARSPYESMLVPSLQTSDIDLILEKNN
ncbi:hypothetical protein A9Q84_05440 [Halobacteriovorax marinus]|uniref:O-methyltransferase C-terminal domain-containing protein n=1 Tax=Halobacteriovorax marinus TaxID=97084 RepID=A0A1Y5FBC1_9BACT|nr:hypothetical protein A9Q84_05440 [Halobacteriovorax marinus]